MSRSRWPMRSTTIETKNVFIRKRKFRVFLRWKTVSIRCRSIFDEFKVRKNYPDFFTRLFGVWRRMKSVSHDVQTVNRSKTRIKENFTFHSERKNWLTIVARRFLLEPDRQVPSILEVPELKMFDCFSSSKGKTFLPASSRATIKTSQNELLRQEEKKMFWIDIFRQIRCNIENRLSKIAQSTFVNVWISSYLVWCSPRVEKQQWKPWSFQCFIATSQYLAVFTF